MKTNLSSPPAITIGGVPARVFWPLLALAAVVIVILAGSFFWRARGDHVETAKQTAGPHTDVVDGVVRLSEAKLKVAGLHASEVERREIQDARRVPGKIIYNASRRLEIKVPAGGVVTRVLVLPGQAVKRGDQLALLDSVEVGTARDELVKAEADLQIVARETDWFTDIAANTDELLEVLDKSPDVQKVEGDFNDKVLGDHREKIFAAYSKLRLATRAAQRAVTAQTALSDLYVQERASAREIADANFRTVCEQSKFDAKQQLARSRAELEHAKHVVAVGRQKLKLLLGPFAEIVSGHDDNMLCELILRSPIDGKVEDRFVSDGVQFVASQALFALANTDTLWVSAQIYEREWAALAGGDVQEVKVQSPALPGYEVTAKVQFLSVGMSSETRAVPLVAELPNAENRLKPGMFAWVDVPLGPKHEALVVPAGAIMRHEEETFVFVEVQHGEYRKVVVTPGLATSDYVEILSGLDVGAKVVDHGAFFLKSELLLEGEEP